MRKIKDFYENTSVVFDIIIYYDCIPAVLSAGNEVKVLIKRRRHDPDSLAVVSKEGVIISIDEGLVSFELTPSETTLPLGYYYLELLWETSEDRRFVIHRQGITCLNKLQDNV